MKKTKFLIVGLILACLIGSCASVYAFDMGNWLKKVLGIKQAEEQPTEIFVPLDEIKIEEVEKEEAADDGKAAVEEKEENAGKETAKDAKAVIAQETDIISLGVDADDPDKDKLSFEYTTPLNENGEWQTTYGDAGEYTVTVTVSDGSLSDSKDVLIIVNKKEETPTIDAFSPESLTLGADENSELAFSITASDKNKDELSYLWKLDGSDVSTTNSFAYKISYDDSGSHTVKATVTDGNLETTKLWSLEVKNVNRKPELKKMDDIKVKETQTVTLTPEAEDPDGDSITYTISEPVGNDGTWETGYDDSGEYKVAVTASDGEDEASQTVKVTVENVNRAPVIKDIVQK